MPLIRAYYDHSGSPPLIRSFPDRTVSILLTTHPRPLSRYCAIYQPDGANLGGVYAPGTYSLTFDAFEPALPYSFWSIQVMAASQCPTAGYAISYAIVVSGTKSVSNQWSLPPVAVGSTWARTRFPRGRSTAMPSLSTFRSSSHRLVSTLSIRHQVTPDLTVCKTKSIAYHTQSVPPFGSTWARTRLCRGRSTWMPSSSTSPSSSHRLS
jgi:hypothetical protein